MFRMRKLNFQHCGLLISNLVQKEPFFCWFCPFFSTVDPFIIIIGILEFYKRKSCENKAQSNPINKFWWARTAHIGTTAKHFHFLSYDNRKIWRWRPRMYFYGYPKHYNYINNYFSAIFFISDKYAVILNVKSSGWASTAAEGLSSIISIYFCWWQR